MSKIEAKQINSPKRLKELKNNSKKESLRPVVLEAPTELEAVEEKTIAQKSNFGEKIKSLFERKIGGAIKEIFRRKELDETVEQNLSEGLENNEEFVAASNKIDKKRNWLVATFNSFLNRKNKEDFAQTPYVFDDIALQGMKELEAELTDSFAKSIYSKLGELNKRVLLDHLVDNPINQDKSEIIELQNASPALDYVVAFSDNGYLLQQIPKDSAETETDRVLYNLISPDGTVLIKNSDYISAFNALEEQSAVYQNKLIEEFAQQKIIQKNLLERERENAQVIEEDVVSSREDEMNKLMDEMLADEEAAILNKEKEQKFSVNYEEEPEVVAVDNTEPTNIDVVTAELETSNEIEVKPLKDLIGEDFNSLSEGQQKFVKEALLQFQLDNAKNEARAQFNQETSKHSETKALTRLWKKITNPYQIAKLEKERIKETKTEIDSEENLAQTEQLIKIAKNINQEITEKDGKLIINFNTFDGLSEECQQQFISFNEKANAFSSLPQEWAFESANSKYQEIFYSAKNEYEILKQELFKKIEEEQGLQTALQGINNIDSQIAMRQFLTNHPNVEQEIKNIKEGSPFHKMFSTIVAERGLVMGLGATSRLAVRGASAFGVISGGVALLSLPVIATVLGAWRGGSRANKTIRELDISGRHQEKNVSPLSVERKVLLDELKTLVPNEFSLNPEAWLAQATEEERVEYIKIKAKFDDINNRFEKEDQGKTSTVGKILLQTDKKSLEANISQSSNLTEKLNSLVNRLENAINTGDINKMEEFGDSLRARVLFSENKLKNGLISFGSGPERNVKYLNFIQSLEKAKVYQGYYNDPGKINTRVYRFMGYLEGKKEHKREVYKAKEIVKGALISVTFFMAGHKLMEGLSHLVSGDVTSESGDVVANNVGKNVEAGVTTNLRGANSLVETSKNVNNLTTPSAAENTKESFAWNNYNHVAENSGSSSMVENHGGVVDTASSNKFVDEISNKGLNGRHDSVWRSTREIFKNHSQELGYKGDVNDHTALNHWAETQTANAIHHSGDINDKIFEGNKVELLRDGNHFKVNIDQSNGPSPKHLTHLVHQETSSLGGAEKTIKVPTQEELLKAQSLTNQTADLAETTNNDDSFFAYDKTTPAAPSAPTYSQHFIEETSKSFHLPAQDVHSVDNDLIYTKTGGGQAIFESNGGGIKSIVDVNKQEIPKDFINTLKGWSSMKQFTKNGGLEKIFTSWNKLGSNDKLIYNSLDWFNKKTLSSADLINQIKGNFQVDTSKVFVEGKRFLVQGDHGKKSFDMTLKGVNKLVEFLKKK